MNELFDGLKNDRTFTNLSPEIFVNKLSEFFSNLNAIHPFREGNGRTQNTYIALLANHAGHPLNFDKIKPEEILKSTINSFTGNTRELEKLILKMIT